MEAGAVHETANEVFKVVGVANTAVGAPAVPDMKAEDAADAGPAPVALEATTVNVYEVPSVRPVIVQGEAAAVQFKPPGDAVAVYVVGELRDAAVQATATEPLTPVAEAVTAVAWFGVPACCDAEEAEAVPVPAALIVATVKL